jgi:hypothetical protein
MRKGLDQVAKPFFFFRRVEDPGAGDIPPSLEFSEAIEIRGLKT